MPADPRYRSLSNTGEGLVEALQAARFRCGPWTGDPNRCAVCNVPAILADTEDWRRPLCPDCWDDLGQPEREPAEA